MIRKIILILATLSMSACGSGMCGEDKLKEAASPDKKYEAAVFARGCGATTGLLYHVNIQKSGIPFPSHYSGVSEDGQLFLTSEGLLNVNWKDEKTLIIDCEGCPADKHRDNKVSEWQDVSIEYQFRERKP